ncbi:AAA family ATPase [Phyllobacterium sp. SYP-B3895]|uniref:AAA family ATPase n=1 Tax=Phyllobacterium sp. SYP-B3895 TaxID=2663240 RepID=UPI001299E45E|nr:AAA family ATPase [Phyllobacterium sp. SYP-B3895]MRG56910.1 AAA family ATPase [Phyllobacterium sp. SYP-B3895]
MQRHIQNNFIILTGGPGSGKTSLIAALDRHGYATSTEAGRAIIRHHQIVDGPAVPWKDPAIFAELMLSWEMRSYDSAADSADLVFFDRGVPDIVGYLKLNGLEVPAHVRKAARIFRYNPTVFILPPWPEIFTQDTERKQTLEEAERTFHAMVSAYSNCGYALVEVPRVPISERVAFLIESIGAVT